MYYLLFIYSTFLTTTFACLPVAKHYYNVMLSLLNSKKAVRIQQFTDGATILLRKHYHTGFNKIKYGFPSTCLREGAKIFQIFSIWGGNQIFWIFPWFLEGDLNFRFFSIGGGVMVALSPKWGWYCCCISEMGWVQWAARKNWGV